MEDRRTDLRAKATVPWVASTAFAALGRFGSYVFGRVAGILWVTCHYDHLFEELNPTRAKLTFVVEGEGFGAPVVGTVFGTVYSNYYGPGDFAPSRRDERKSGVMMSSEASQVTGATILFEEV
jgi:hypothetical protein